LALQISVPAGRVLSLAEMRLSFGAPPGSLPAKRYVLAGFLPRRDVRPGSVNAPILVTLAILGLAMAAQIVPVPDNVVQRLNPGTTRFLQEYDLAYQLTGPRNGKAEALRYRERTGGKAEASPYRGLSIAPSQTRLTLGLFAAVAVLLLGLARGFTARDARRFVPALLALGVVLALVGIVQRATFNGKLYGFWVPEAGIRPSGPTGGPFGPFVNRNHFAGWMLMALPLGIGYFGALVARGMRISTASDDVPVGWRRRLLWFSSRDANRVILAGAGLLVMGLALVLTLSRSGITGFAIALALSAWVVLRRQAKGSRRAVLATYLAILAVLSVGWVGVDLISSRFAQTQVDLPQRLAAWNDTLRIARDFPVFGSGLGTFGTAMIVYQTAANRTVRFTESHNDYLQLLSEGGVLVALLAVAFIAVFVREVRRRFRDDTNDETTYWIRVGAVTGIVAIALQEIVEFSLQMPGNAALFAVLMAISAGRLPHRASVRARRSSSTRDARAG
jgi:O-antigen ligase